MASPVSGEKIVSAVPPRRRDPLREARDQLSYELASGVSGVALATFMWGHMFLVGSILAGEKTFNSLASGLERFYIAQPTVVAVSALFLLHAALASRKIPAQLRERRRMREIAKPLRESGVRGPGPHYESMLWIWQVRTGMVVLVIGSFHLILEAIDVLTPLFGERVGIEASSSMARVSGGLWPFYALLLLCVEFHAGVGLYRFAVKWGLGARLSRRVLRRIEHVIFWSFLGFGTLTLVVLAGWIEPPLRWMFES